ncbi:MAG: WecB/TagA/CpsF family glycosyltransferase [Bacteroidota bacterium]
MPELTLLGVRVDAFDRDTLEEAILADAAKKECRIYEYINVHALNLACDDPRFRDALNSATVTYCDGEGVRVGARVLGRRLPPRTVLTYWIWDLCRRFQEEGRSVYFLGGHDEVVRKAVDLLRQRFPALKIAGWHHGYFAKPGEESRRIVDDINRAGPDVLFVGFGMPVQEFWIAEHRTRLSVGVILPAGSMIDYIAGTRTPAPAWMAGHGLEWLYRLCREPGRLWRRYLLGNPLFLLRVIAQRIRSGTI